MERKYETLVLLKPDSPQEKTQAILDRVKEIIDADGVLLDLDNWGKKKLAYEVQKQTKGIYVLFTYLAIPSIIAEIERNLRLNLEVMKFLTVMLEERVDRESEIQTFEEKKAKREEERAARESGSEDDDEEEEKEEKPRRRSDRDRDRDRDRNRDDDDDDDDDDEDDDE